MNLVPLTKEARKLVREFAKKYHNKPDLVQAEPPEIFGLYYTDHSQKYCIDFADVYYAMSKLVGKETYERWLNSEEREIMSLRTWCEK